MSNASWKNLEIMLLFGIIVLLPLFSGKFIKQTVRYFVHLNIQSHTEGQEGTAYLLSRTCRNYNIFKGFRRQPLILFSFADYVVRLHVTERYKDIYICI